PHPAENGTRIDHSGKAGRRIVNRPALTRLLRSFPNCSVRNADDKARCANLKRKLRGHMRFLTGVLLLAASIPFALAQSATQHGIGRANSNTKAVPCTDFSQYGNGTWHAKNPIPGYMDRGSRRWQAGENAKDQLKEILDDVSRRTDWAKGSVEQLIGDYYGSCMDEARINKLGIAPAQPMLKDIDNMKTPADVQRMIRRFHALGIFAPF